MKIILDAYIRYGSKWLMAKVYDGEELVHAQTAPSEQLREIMKRDFPTAEMIEPANQYLQTVYNDAKSKGYNPTEPNLMTLERARQSDEWAMSNGDSAYSEYEQSLGGNLQISLK
ncbi:hypothetical protein selz8t1_137 [Salmonella phage selz]|nr:hypothetical protein selz8t1_137 [Salmonella phage selz]